MMPSEGTHVSTAMLRGCVSSEDALQKQFPTLKAFIVNPAALPTSWIWVQAQAKVAELRACKAKHVSSRQALLQPWDCHFYAVRLRVR